MLIAGITLFIGFISGLRLTLLSFVVAMAMSLSGVALLNFVMDASLLTVIGHLAQSAFCLQAGYLAGLLVRVRATD